MKALGLLLLAAGATVWSADLETIKRGIEKRYNNAKTLQVNFTEIYTEPPRKTTDKGVLYRKQGGNMRWEYTMPPDKLWISDGKNSFDYDPTNHRAKETPLKQDDDMRAPLAFLMGRIDFERDFGKYETAQDGTITAWPKSDQFPYSQISFVTDAQFAIVKLTVKLQGRSQIEYQFDGEKLNVPIDDKKFRFTPPPGVQVEKPLNSH